MQNPCKFFLAQKDQSKFRKRYDKITLRLGSISSTGNEFLLLKRSSFDPAHTCPPSEGFGMKDRLGRIFRDLRISVTDRCNMRCVYCMPKEHFNAHYPFLGKDELLTFDEIHRLAKIFAPLGVHKIRITGGEPLLRHHIEDLIARLSTIPDIELTMTTNGTLLSKKAKKLKDAGLDRVTVSLDSDDDATFRIMSDVGYHVEQVFRGIHAAEEAGLTPIKINMVVKKGINEESILSMADRFRGTGHILRFIEYMDVGSTNDWSLEEVVPAAEIIERVNRAFAIEPIEPNYAGEVARRWSYKDGSGEIGIIASVTQPFCGDCSRARLSADGKLYTCLFAVDGFDLRERIRKGVSDQEITELIRERWSHRTDRYSEVRNPEIRGSKRIEMSYIGG
jgi:cyclic pyranopterin phosphate synthase